jgi:ubiquinone/menaquinone biosynthesis C-methylase UbiE
VTEDHAASTRKTRDAVIDRYSGLARTALAGGAPTDCDADAFADGCFGAAAYPGARDVPEAALRASLGCGNPLAVASLQPGETVLDLGSGGGLDVLLSARRVSPTGTAYGLDASTDMLKLARANATRAGVGNAEFLHGHIEDIPLPDEQIDVVISNCVINLAADKRAVIAEVARVLRPGGRFAVSDVIADPDMDALTRADMAARTGCIAGALSEQEFRSALAAAGLTDVEVHPTHRVHEHAGAAIVRARKPEAR